VEHVARRSSLNIPTPLLGMWIFLMTEVMLFCGMITAFAVLRSQSGAEWPPADMPMLPLWLSGGNLVVLLASGAAVFAARRQNGLGIWMVAAVALSALFLGIQGYEWSRVLGQGAAGVGGTYTGLFYSIIALHSAHVFAGVFALVRSWRKALAGDGGASLSIWSLYWYFVVGVWPILFVLLYLV
jgi:heme/copper-type cytochrome/quinol oxidase subunit 3